MGSPIAVVPVLDSVRELGWDLVGVYTASDQQAGRGRHVEPTPVKRYALEQGFPVFQPASLRDEQTFDELRSLAPDLIVLAAYGELLPPEVLDLPRWGCLNVHPSLLPRHRGASPVAAAILAGDEMTGVTLMIMDRGLDTGPLLGQREQRLWPTNRSGQLTEQLFVLGAELLKEVLPEYVAGRITPAPQAKEGVSISRKMKKEQGELDWFKAAVQLEREVRAHDPWPGSATRWNGKRLQVLEAHAMTADTLALPGTVVQIGMDPPLVGVATLNGLLVLHQVKQEGRKTVAATEFIRGNQEFLDARLPS